MRFLLSSRVLDLGAHPFCGVLLPAIFDEMSFHLVAQVKCRYCRCVGYTSAFEGWIFLLRLPNVSKWNYRKLSHSVLTLRLIATFETRPQFLLAVATLTAPMYSVLTRMKGTDS